LFAYERREQHDPNSSLAGASGTLMEIAHTLSATADWHPSRPYWLTGRVARQYRDGIYENDTHSTYVGTLLAGRATWDFTPRWDASLLAASLSDSGGAQRAWGLEVGRSLATNLWLGMGYNFEGFYADPSLSGSSMTRKGLFIRLRMKFDERMFADKKDGGSSVQPPP
jgi:hypothetical protein